MNFGDTPKLTEADKKLQQETQEKLNKISKDLQPFFQEYSRILEQSRKAGETQAHQTERDRKLKELQEKYKDRMNERGKLYETLRKFQRPYFYHGHVWLFQRRPTEKTSSR